MPIELANKINELSYRMQLLSLGEDPASDASDLSPRDCVILVLLNQLGQMNVSKIASAYSHVSESTISTTITRLWKDKGLVSKTINPENQRETFVELTKKGKAAVEELMDHKAQRFRLLLQGLNVDEHEQEVLIKILDRAIGFFDKRLGLDGNKL